MAAFSGGESGGKRLTIGPNCAVLEVFFLPDGNGAFQGVDEPAAGLESGGAVGRSDHDGNAGLADLETAETVHEGDIAYEELRERLLRQRFHLFESHFRIGFVIQIKSAAAASVIADYSFEDYSSAIFGLFELFKECLRVDGPMDDGSVTGVPSVLCNGTRMAGASADGR